MGPLEMIPAILFVMGLISSVGVQLAKYRATTLVIQTFKTSLRPQPAGEPSVEISGRMQGLVAFALTLMGFSPVVRFTICGSELRCESTSLFGQRQQFIPLRCVSTMAAGVHKPISALIWGVFAIILGLTVSLQMRAWAPFLISIPISLGLLGLYVVSKKFFLEIHAQGGPPIALLFRPNVLEGVPIDVNRALELVAIIRDRILVDGETTAPAASSGRNRPRDYEEAEYETGAWASPEAESDEAAATELFEKARRFVQDGDRDRAVATLQEIVRRYPGTEIAEQARRLLQRRGH